MSDEFLIKLFGNDIYKVIKSTLDLVDTLDFTIPNTENYDFNSLTGEFKLTKDTNLYYDSLEENNILIVIHNFNSTIWFAFNRNKELIFYEYKEMLKDGSLLYFGYFNDGEQITGIYDEKTCRDFSINQTTDLDFINARNILPTYFDSKISKHELNDLLSKLNNLKELKSAIDKPKKRGK